MANKLIDEQSPYLLQHAFNPVDWRPWGDEAFLKAKTENKPLLVSIGYSACHWCHVMEHESFEDDDVAAYMNEHFVCIKVDREEHPDVDHLYMDAVQAIAGNGGWPLNVFVTPDRAPFYGGTYYPPRPAYNRPSWMQILNRMNEIWQNQRGEAEQQAGQLVAHLRQASAKGASAAAPRGAGFCREIADNLLKQADKEMGGFGNAPKFPGTMAIIFLLEHYRFTGYEPALKHALRSLDAMIDGGIYDQLAGGFARYATDRNWLVPHFEKMLYDNALVVSALCDAYSITKDLRYKIIIEETINFIETELKDKSGGYYCALDADSEGVEGKFYTWTWQEWTAALGGNDPVPAQYFGVRPEGNWEGTNILHVAATMEDVARQDCITVTEAKQRIDAAKRKLLAARRYRLRPGTDDKSLLSWNALMNITLTKAGVCLGPGAGDKYIDRAGAHMEWMMAAYNGPDGLLHAWKDGKAKIPAKLDDYAYLVQAMLQLASASGENNWVLQANALMETITKDFAHGAGFYYFTSEQQKDIIVRKLELYDGAMPSANAVMAHNLWICGMCMERADWLGAAVDMIQSMADTTLRYSYSYGYWATLLQRNTEGMKTVICAGNNVSGLARNMQEKYLPHAFLLTCTKEICDLPILKNKYFDGKLHIFVCSEQACLSPVTTEEQALSLIG